MKIAVYSGSFRPLHKGHLAIMEFLTGRAGFDKVYLVVTPANPFKDVANQLSGEERYRAAVEAVGRYPQLKVQVEDLELRMSPPQYTIRTLDALREREPGNSFTLVIGADNLENFDKWRDYQRILTEYGIVVFPRKGYHRGHLAARLRRSCPGAKIYLVKAPNVTISSTRIRKSMASGEDMGDWLM